MNYQALSALGLNYPSLPQANIDEMHHRQPMGELPHFKDVFARAKGQPRVGGVWQYYTAQIAQDL